MANLQDLYTAVLEGDADLATETTEAAIKEGVDPKTVIDKHMIPAMDEVGRRFECNDYFVPELLIAARAMKASRPGACDRLVGLAKRVLK